MTNPDHQLEPDEPAGAASLDHQQQVPDKQTTQTDTSLQPESPPDPHVQGDNIGEEPPPSNRKTPAGTGQSGIQQLQAQQLQMQLQAQQLQAQLEEAESEAEIEAIMAKTKDPTADEYWWDPRYKKLLTIVPGEEDHITKDRIRLASRLSMMPQRAPKSLGAFPKKPPVLRQLADVLEEIRDTERKHYLEQKPLRSDLPPSLDVPQLAPATAPGPEVNHRFWSPRGPREVQIPQSLLNSTAEPPQNRQQHREPPDPVHHRPQGSDSGPTD